MNSPVHQFTSSPVIKLAFSPCPNDTFIFDALVHNKIDTEGISFDFGMSDVEELNHQALRGQVDMCKVSYHAWLYLRQNYVLLDSGSAMGFGNGPLVIGKQAYSLKDLVDITIAIPGEYTTANLLLRIFAPDVKKKRIMVFSEIEDAVLKGEVEAGVIIHENRFTYQKKGLIKIADLGEQWELMTHSPIPLGAIVVKKTVGSEMISRLNRIMKKSVEYALNDPDSSMDFVRANAQEMDDSVMHKHIELYVNEYTRDLGVEGENAIRKLQEMTINILNTDDTDKNG